MYCGVNLSDITRKVNAVLLGLNIKYMAETTATQITIIMGL